MFNEPIQLRSQNSATYWGALRSSIAYTRVICHNPGRTDNWVVDCNRIAIYQAATACAVCWISSPAGFCVSAAIAASDTTSERCGQRLKILQRDNRLLAVLQCRWNRGAVDLSAAGLLRTETRGADSMGVKSWCHGPTVWPGTGCLDSAGGQHSRGTAN